MWVINLLLKLPQKRSRQQVDKGIRAKKVAKMEEETQEEPMVKEQRVLEAKITIEAMLEARKLKLEELMSQVIGWKMGKLQVKVVGGKPDFELNRFIKPIMELTPEYSRVAMEAQFSRWYEEMKSLFLTYIDASQWANIEMELGITKRTIHSNNIDNSDVPVAALLPSLSPSSRNVSLPFNDLTFNPRR
ncbi:hypothetical protein L6452_32801 [Arctium lappa]|uniref:Uncharacterized protein n=1 Tax=Arctium lappa TaxID=4217 RepID=A0ACB8Z5I1_ARCLA|nr:hypothetical protein L6452_32801 [Arctium lappa]